MNPIRHGMPLLPHAGFSIHDGDGDGELNALKVMKFAPAPPLENFVVKGAGARGYVYPGCVIELENAGLLKNIKRVCGSSAGALTAALVGLGYTGEQLLKFALETDLTVIQDVSTQRLGTLKRFAHIIKNLSSKELGAAYRGEVLLGIIRVLVQDRVDEAIQKLLKNKSQFDRDTILAQLMSINLITATQPKITFNSEITFKHIDFLRKHFSETGIKEIYISVTNCATKENEMLHAKNRGDEELAKAIAMSMAIPHVFAKIKGKNGQFYMDGGCSLNNPYAYFEAQDFRHPDDVIGKKDKTTAPNLRTVCIEAATKQEMTKSLWTSKDRSNKWYLQPFYFMRDKIFKPMFIIPISQLKGKLLKSATGVDVEAASKKNDADIYDRGGQRAIQLFDEDLGMLQFDASFAEKQKAVKSSRSTTKAWIHNYIGQLVHESYKFSELPLEQLVQLHDYATKADVRMLFHDTKRPLEILNERKKIWLDRINERILELRGPVNAGEKRVQPINIPQMQSDQMHDDREALKLQRRR